MKHDNSISVIRVIAMIMIVLYHCFCYNAGIWSFGGPITYNDFGLAIIRDLSLLGLNFFVLISGLLYYRIEETGKYNNTCKFLNNKIKRLLVPYIIWGILLCLILYGRQDPMDIFYGISHLWFLLMLFEIFVIITLTKSIWKEQGLKGSLFLLLIIMAIDFIVSKGIYDFHIIKGKPLLDFHKTLHYLPLFYIGIIIERFHLYKKLSINKHWMFIVASILLAITILLSSNLPIHFARILRWISTCLLFTTIYSSLTATKLGKGERNMPKLLMILDKYSLAIYIIHHILIFVYLDYIPNSGYLLTSHYLLAPLIMFVIILPLSLFISILLTYLPFSEYIVGISESQRRDR